MPITTGMLLGMIKQLDKRIKLLEKQVREPNTPESKEGKGEGEIRVGEDTVSDLGTLHS